MKTFHNLYALALAFCLFSVRIRAAEPATALKEACRPWFAVGAALPGNGLTAEEEALLAVQFTNFTTENCLKAAIVHPDETTYAFEQGDSLIRLAEKHHLTVNGHTLIWHHTCPDWFFEDNGKPASHDLVLSRMKAHIAAVAGHYRGRIHSWDVVNEAISDKPEEYLRPTKWETSIGQDFVLEAYLAAQKADPSAELYYNDYGIEQPAKRAKALRLIRELRTHGARVDGIGIQGHWETGKVPFSKIDDSIVAFHGAGLKVMITELDLDVVPRKSGSAEVGEKEKTVEDPYANGCPPEVLQRQAEDYAALFRLFRKHSDKITRVTFWNLHDGRSWLNKWPRKRTNYPLLWDRQLQPKPAFFSVLQALTQPTQTPPHFSDAAQ